MTTTVKVCPRCTRTFLPTRTTQVYCTPLCRDGRTNKRDEKAHAAKYGTKHRRLRKIIQKKMDAGQQFHCVRCNQPIIRGQAWHLDHQDDGINYRGPAHQKCNTREAARHGNRLRSKKNPPKPTTPRTNWASRPWF